MSPSGKVKMSSFELKIRGITNDRREAGEHESQRDITLKNIGAITIKNNNAEGCWKDSILHPIVKTTL